MSAYDELSKEGVPDTTGFGRSGFAAPSDIGGIRNFGKAVSTGIGALGPLGLFGLLSKEDHGQADLATQNAFAEMEAENEAISSGDGGGGLEPKVVSTATDNDPPRRRLPGEGCQTPTARRAGTR